MSVTFTVFSFMDKNKQKKIDVEKEFKHRRTITTVTNKKNRVNIQQPQENLSALQPNTIKQEIL